MNKRISKRFKEDGHVVRKGKKQHIARKMAVQRLVCAKDQNLPEWRHVLIDYRNENEHVKAKMMTPLDAWKLNQMLAGSGFAWARCGG